MSQAMLPSIFSTILLLIGLWKLQQEANKPVRDLGQLPGIEADDAY